jgi:TPR repeat protein
MAPEVLLGEQYYTQSVDVYSYAISIFVILTGLEPYPKNSAYQHTRRVAAEKKRPTVPNGFAAPVAALMAKCWQAGPELRPTFPEIVAEMETPALLEGVDAAQFAAFQERIRLGSKARQVAPEEPVAPGPSPIDVLREQAAAGDINALLTLADKLLKGDGVDADSVGALALLEQAHTLGSSDGTLAYAIALLDDGRTQEQKLAGLEHLIHLAAGPDGIAVDAAYQLGLLHRRGGDVLVPQQAKAFAYFKQAAEGGHPDAEQYYAMYLDQGLGCAPDLGRACKFYRRSADHASPRGMFRYARMLLLGNGIAANIPEAVRLFECSAQQGCDEANFCLWGLFTAGFEGAVARDPVRAERHARIGAERGIVGCELEYADLLPPGAERDNYRAHAFARGRAEFQLTAGRLYEEGLLFPANYDRARRLYEAAVANGGKEGLFELARLVLQQFGEDDLAAQLLRTGATKRCVQCRFFLAQEIHKGTLIPESPDEKKQLLQQARTQHCLEAAVMLGQLFIDEGLYPRAKSQFEAARGGGSADGSEWLATCYENGWGVAKNPAKVAELKAEAQARRERDAGRARGDGAPGLAASGRVPRPP